MAHYLFMAMVAATVCIHFTLADTETAETESLRTSLSGLRATLRILVSENWSYTVLLHDATCCMLHHLVFYASLHRCVCMCIVLNETLHDIMSCFYIHSN